MLSPIIKMTEMETDLIVIQIDHLTGEDIGNLIEKLYVWGAKNVNVFPTITKKNRPAYVLMLDMGISNNISLGKKLAEEFRVWGYHVIKSTHYHHMTNLVSCKIRVRYKSRHFETELRVKKSKFGTDESCIRVEYEDLSLLKAEIEKQFHLNVSLETLRGRIENLFVRNDSLKFHLHSDRNEIQNGFHQCLEEVTN